MDGMPKKRRNRIIHGGHEAVKASDPDSKDAYLPRCILYVCLCEPVQNKKPVD